MRVLLIGSGGREHALAWSLTASPLLTELFVAPGNAGIASLARCIGLDATDHDAIIRFCWKERISLVVIGPERPLVAGLADDLEREGIKVFGPSKAAAQLEGSKGFTKDLCREHGIPTADYQRFSGRKAARDYLQAKGAPIVIKADGLAAGKGVVVADSIAEAEAAVDALLAEPGAEILIEEKLEGEEASFFALVDGETALPLATAQDHKRACDGDQGPNTGGMGAYSPAPIMTDPMCLLAMEEIVLPTIRAMAARGTPFKGVLYAGLMITADGPKLIEYNVRFGDPECQVLMMRLKSDLLPALFAVHDGVLHDFDLRWSDEAALAVVMAANGYPGAHETGSVIEGLDAAALTHGVEIFHAGTKRRGDHFVSAGGRVLTVTARGRTVRKAHDRAYAAIEEIDWPGGFYRTDIGWRAMAREDTPGP